MKKRIKVMRMVIYSQSRQAIWNFDDVSRLHVTGQGTGIQIVARNGSGGEVAKYHNREQASFVLGMFVSAVAAGDKTFDFPTETEMEHAKQHGSNGGGKRHGGS